MWFRTPWILLLNDPDLRERENGYIVAREPLMSNAKFPSPAHRPVPHYSKRLQAPSWLWTSVVDLVATHEAASLEHCRRFPIDLTVQN